MHKIRRVAMMAALAISAFGASAGAASAAITVSNPGTLTGSDSGNVQFKATLYSFPVTVTCTTANLTGSVTSSGASSITASTFTGCTDGLGGSVTVASTGFPWAAQIKGSTGAYRLDSLPARVNITPSFGSTCAYNGGTLTSSSVASPASTIPYSNAGPLTSTTSGCGNGTLTGTYNLSKSLTISGSL